MRRRIYTPVALIRSHQSHVLDEQSINFPGGVLILADLAEIEIDVKTSLVASTARLWKVTMIYCS